MALSDFSLWMPLVMTVTVCELEAMAIESLPPSSKGITCQEASVVPITHSLVNIQKTMETQHAIASGYGNSVLWKVARKK